MHNVLADTAGLREWVDHCGGWRPAPSAPAYALDRVGRCASRVNSLFVLCEKWILRVAALPADQPVDGDHQAEGEARDAKKYDAEEHALHLLLTAGSQDGSTGEVRGYSPIL